MRGTLGEQGTESYPGTLEAHPGEGVSFPAMGPEASLLKLKSRLAAPCRQVPPIHLWHIWVTDLLNCCQPIQWRQHTSMQGQLALLWDTGPRNHLQQLLTTQKAVTNSQTHAKHLQQVRPKERAEQQGGDLAWKPYNPVEGFKQQVVENK